MHYDYWSGAYPAGWMILHAAFWIVFLAALLIGAIFLARSLRSSSTGQETLTALDILDQRYARGEIDRDEYLRRKSDILEGKSAAGARER